MIKMGFVLLHYNNIDVTREAVKFIRNQNIKECELYIVIVDNASPNGTGSKLVELYKDDLLVKIILNERNVGFAQGNNIGYSFARNTLCCAMIIVMNTDVYIQDNQFINKLLNVKESVEIIAPDICGKNGVHQNPFRIGMLTDKKLKEIYEYNKWINIIYKIPGINGLIAYYLENRKKTNDIKKNETIHYNVTPHGACIIYTAKWIEKEDIAFDPNTFMYMEEDVLMEYIHKKGYMTMYCPDLVVNHMEDASTDFSFSGIIKRRRFISENTKNSALYLIRKRRG